MNQKHLMGNDGEKSNSRGHDEILLFYSVPNWDMVRIKCLNGLLEGKENNTEGLFVYIVCRVCIEWFVVRLYTVDKELWSRGKGEVLEKEEEYLHIVKMHPECISNVLYTAGKHGKDTLCLICCIYISRAF